MNLVASRCSAKLHLPFSLPPIHSKPQILSIHFKFCGSRRENLNVNFCPSMEIWAVSGGIFHRQYSSGRKRRGERAKWAVFSFSSSAVQTEETQNTSTEEESCRVKLQTLNGCKLGIGRYPDFEYNAEGGGGEGIGKSLSNGRVDVMFDVQSIHIPALTFKTTKFLGFPLPPFLRISIAPQSFHGFIEQNTGKVELNFRANFYFSVSSLYKPPPLVVETLLTTEATKGEVRNGRGERLDSEGCCRLVGVATVVPINDYFLNAFLNLPTECLADMSAKILVLT
eukprot:Gb_11488 [translate_table: standard]